MKYYEQLETVIKDLCNDLNKNREELSKIRKSCKHDYLKNICIYCGLVDNRLVVVTDGEKYYGSMSKGVAFEFIMKNPSLKMHLLHAPSEIGHEVLANVNGNDK